MCFSLIIGRPIIFLDIDHAQALRLVCYTRAVSLLELTSNSCGCLIKCYLQRMYKYLGIEATLEVLIIGFWNVECSYMF
jgi:hypothetical protein